MIRTLIVDDEVLARRGIRARLRQHPDFEIVGECANGREAIAEIREKQPDVLFLDVQMPGLDGFDVLAALEPRELCFTIFVTAFDQHAVKAFEANALDYLLKPVGRRRFEAAIDRARLACEQRSRHDLAGRYQNLLQDRGHVKRLVLKTPGRIALIDTARIDWMEADGDYVRIHEGAQRHFVRQTLSSIEKQLDAEQFVRIHRSRIVNAARIRELRPWLNGEFDIILQDASVLRSGRGYRDRVRGILNSLTRNPDGSSHPGSA